MFRRRVLVLIGVICIFLVALSGCGGLDFLNKTTISGQIVLNGTATNDCRMHLYANDKTYFGDVIASNGRFSHSDTGLDKEFCVQGCVIDFAFNSDAPGACDSTMIRNYVVVKGTNNLGTIEIGSKGLSLLEPAASASPSDLPVTFSWNPYSDTSAANLSYNLVLYNVTHTPFGDWKNAVWTSLDTLGTTYELTRAELDGNEEGVTHWSVVASFKRNGLYYEKTLEERPITLPAASEAGL